MDNLAHIYFLSDVDGVPRYIGKTCNIKQRMIGHRSKRSLSSKTYKNNWIRSIGIENLQFHVIDSIPEIDWPFWEIHYISLYKSWGFTLTNTKQGGTGLHMTSSKEKVKKEKVKRVLSDSHKEAIRLGNSNKPCTEEKKRKISETLLSKNNRKQKVKVYRIRTKFNTIHSAETLAKIAAANTDVVFTQERKNKIKAKALERSRMKKLPLLLEILSRLSSHSN